MSEREEYLGDGCYCSFDGYAIWLRAPRENGDHVVALEPAIFNALTAYARQVWKVPADPPAE
ncbi:hypothetical protein [Bradyrhizobium genosp. P]|uniref:hypothetical protein n=1 Tax=Bradyrhizobium genosp. P TaxID=83641 RepID=UPI003CE8B7D3